MLTPPTADDLEGKGRLVFRYHDNPTGLAYPTSPVSSSASGSVVGLEAAPLARPPPPIEAVGPAVHDGLVFFFGAVTPVQAQ